MDFDKVKEEINKKYPNVKVVDIEDNSGSLSMKVEVGDKELAYLDRNSKNHPIKLIGFDSASSNSIYRRDALTRSDLDLMDKSVLKSTPQELFKKSMDYYYTKDIYGTVIRNLSNFASTGFENDIDDEKIKLFFDNWAMDIGFDAIIEQIFFDLFRVGMVRTYKVIGKYSTNINTFKDIDFNSSDNNNSASAAKKYRWSKEHIPINYTILNPLLIEIEGSLLFGQTYVVLKAAALDELRELLEKQGKNMLTEAQLLVLNSVPKEMLKAAKERKPYVFDQNLIGEVDYRKQPYERYPKPRGVAAFDVIDYKDELRKADFSTLDGITNHILKITVGNDKFPVTDQAVLDNIAELFNTPSKAYQVLWNHTLQVEKIVSPEIEAILGSEKYKQVNEDYTGALGFVRALIDGAGDVNPAAATLAMKGVIAEIEYVRKQVKRWINREYKSIAEAMGFDRYPIVRFNDIELRDVVELMRVYQGMIDRRVMSYETGIKKLGLDPYTEKERLKKEKTNVISGDFGIIGSPYQKSSSQPLDTNIQEKQRTPKGTPSEGRPPDSPNKNTVKDESNKVKATLELIGDMTEEEFYFLLEKIKTSEG